MDFEPKFDEVVEAMPKDVTPDKWDEVFEVTRKRLQAEKFSAYIADLERFNAEEKRWAEFRARQEREALEWRKGKWKRFRKEAREAIPYALLGLAAGIPLMMLMALIILLIG